MQGRDIKKSGENTFAKYKYLELGDFLMPAQQIFHDLGLCGVVSFTAELATLTITDIETDRQIVITSPMSSAALKGCHEVQNVGAVETYQRRYLWVTALEIVEHDAIDAGGEPDQDMSPKARAGRIADGVKNGDATGAALAMSGWDEKTIDTVWGFIDPEIQAKLTAAWPKG